MRVRLGVKVLNWPATILTEDLTIVATTRSVSGNGAYIIYDLPGGSGLTLDLHTRVGLIIKPPNRLPLLLRAEVTWSDVLSSDEKNILVGVGLHFIEVHHENRQFLQSLIAQYCRARLTNKSLIPKQDRREHARIETCWPVKIVTSKGIVKGEIRNISKGGALINCQDLPMTEDPFELSIEIPEHRLTVAAAVEKVRLTIDESDCSSASYELAVRFLEVNIEQRRILSHVIS